MRTITIQIRRLAVLFTIMTLALAAMPLAGSAQNTTDDQKERCKNGGWETLTDADGDGFSNQGECVSYIATGGTFDDTDTGLEEPPVDPEPETTVPILHVTSRQLTVSRCEYTVWLENPPSGQEFWLSAVGSIPAKTIYGWDGTTISPSTWEQIGANGLSSVEVLEADGSHSTLASVSIPSCGSSASDDLFGF